MAKLEFCELSHPAGNIGLRSAEAADASGLLALLRTTADETDFLIRSSDELTISTEDYAAVLQRKAESASDVFLVALLEGRCVGSATLSGSKLKRFRHEATLAIVVLQEVWGRGVGSALLRTLLAWADSNQVMRVALEVDAANERAIRLYRAHGFELEGRLRARKRLGSTFTDDLVMARVRLDAAAVTRGV